MEKETEKTDKKQSHDKPWQFPAGESGNPSGRPKGSRNRATIAMQSLLEGEGEKLTRKAVELALAGDTTALRLCMERIMPSRKDNPISLELPMPLDQHDIAQIMAFILAATLAGEITPSEGQSLSALAENYRKAKETTELEQRIAALEGVKHG
jgi:hypothetical protein